VSLDITRPAFTWAANRLDDYVSDAPPAQQKILWAQVRDETGRERDRLKIQDFFTDGQCRPAILDFLHITDVGRRVGAGHD